jgi:8-oxo-dGTP pyrophosphatase MutT (NUDIX family)
MEQDQAQRPREVSRQTLAEGRFLNLQVIRWIDADGRERLWEAAGRRADQQAVMLITWLAPSGRLVLVRQHRPPAGSAVIEFPAGLIDNGEDPGQAALRELHEETGYRGRVAQCFAPAYNTPGLSGEAAHVLLVEVDELAEENQHPAPRPDDGERIEVLLVGRGELGGFLERELAAGSRFDSKVIAYLLGLGCGPGTAST